MRMPATLSLITALMIAACQPQADAPAAPTTASETVAAPSMTAPTPTPGPTDTQVSQAQASVPERPDMAPVEMPAADLSCRATLGEAASARLVERCIAVSPATRPPCNAANTCDLIQGEIDRSCAMYGPDEIRPTQCTV